MDYLIQLIRKLSAKEKAHFKSTALRLSKRDYKNYLDIYEYIIRHPKLSSKQLKSAFSHSPLGKHFSSECNYLFQQILKSLLYIHLEKSPYKRLLKLLFYHELLIEKEEPNKAKKLLSQCKQLAYEYEEFSILLKIISIEEQKELSSPSPLLKENILRLKEERQEISLKIDNANHIKLLRILVTDLKNQKGLHIAHPERFPDVFEEEVMRNESFALSEHARNDWYYVKGLSLRLTGRYEEAIELFEKRMHFVQSKPAFFGSQVQTQAVYNYLAVFPYSNNTTSFEKQSHLFDHIKTDAFTKKETIEAMRITLHLRMYYAQLKSKKLETYIAQGLVFLDKKHEAVKPRQRERLRSILIPAMMETTQATTALTLLENWEQDSPSENSFFDRQLLRMLLYFQLKQWNKLEESLENSEKSLGEQSFTQLGHTCIETFRNTLKKPERTKLFLHQWLQELEEIKQLPNEKQYFFRFAYDRWTKNQISSL